MKKTVVVGGGIVGITAAYFAKKNGDEVILIDSEKHLGGLLKSSCNEYGCFDYGTHVAAKTGVNELDHFLFSDFSKSNSYQFDRAESGNFFLGRLSEVSPHVDSGFLPENIFNKGSMELLSSSNKLGENLKDTLLHRYGNVFYQEIFEDVVNKFFGYPAELLANECIRFFEMNRLLAFDKKASEWLKEVAIFDEKIGFHSSSKGGEKYYPLSGGIGWWITNLENKLKASGVVIKKEVMIQDVKVAGKGFDILTDNQSFQTDKLIWTLSSGLLNRFIKTGIKGSKPEFRKTALYDFVFDQPLQSKSCYINVYDKNFLSGRVTNYQNLQDKPNFYACTVEVLKNEDFVFEEVIGEVEQELFAMGLVTKENNCLFRQCRVLKEGFPILKTDNIKSLNMINKYYNQHYPNITLLGRSSGKGFFMSELLISAYEKVN